MSETMRLEGIEPLLKLLNQLTPNVIGKLVKPAMQEAGNLLAGQERMHAYRQLQGAQGRGYKRKKTGPHLYETAATRAKIYRKGGGVYVAVGFDYKKGGSHGHLVELGHRIVRGGTLDTGLRMPGISAAGERHLGKFGWTKGSWNSTETILHGKRKGKPRKFKGGWKLGDTVVRGSFFKGSYLGKQIRGGGSILKDKSGGTMVTRKFPMLKPAFDEMKRPMLIAIENELKKIEPKARELAGNLRGGGQITGFGRSSAG